jgi:serine phosphatase RsbU (regulator of sigma subunit)
VFLTSPADRDARFPALLEGPLVPDDAYAIVPLQVDEGAPLGALVLGFAEPQAFDEPVQELLGALATQCATALHRARLIADAERDAARLGFLADASALLSNSLDFDETLRHLAEVAVPRLADWCSIYVKDAFGDARPLVTAHADRDRAAFVAELNERFPIATDGPGLGTTLRTGKTEFYPDIAGDELAHVAVDDEHLALLNTVGFGSGASVALRARGRILGAMALANDRGRPMVAADVGLAEQIAERAAIAVDNIRLLDEARRAAQRTVQLQQATAATARALSVEDVADVVLEHGRMALGARAGGVSLLDEGGATLRLTSAFGYPDAVVQQWSSYPLDFPGPMAEAVRTGQAVFIPSRAELAERYPHLSEHVARVDDQAWAHLPLTTTGAAFGAVSFAFDREGGLDDDDRVLAWALSAQAAQAFERARLYSAEHAIAQALQRSLLPPSLPEVDGVELGARYRPAGEGIDVGGDFYDVFPLGPDRWAVMVGDVCGTGPAAAAMTAQVRHTARALGTAGLPLEPLIESVNDALVGTDTTGRFCTLLYGELWLAPPSGAAAELRAVAAGHPHPVVVRGDGRVEELGGRGQLLGLFRPVICEPATVALDRGDAVVLVTDGVLEARPALAERPTFGGFFGAERLAEVVRAHNGESADAIAGEVTDAVLAHSGGHLEDDVAVLVLRISA